jgi:hypothetical protein
VKICEIRGFFSPSCINQRSLARGFSVQSFSFLGYIEFPQNRDTRRADISKSDMNNLLFCHVTSDKPAHTGEAVQTRYTIQFLGDNVWDDERATKETEAIIFALPEEGHQSSLTIAIRRLRSNPPGELIVDQDDYKIWRE